MSAASQSAGGSVGVSPRTGILTGIRVLDFASMIAGSYCTRLLADLGAEVIKCEPLTGDYIRFPPPLRDGKSAYYAHLNCGKKSLCIDLKHPAVKQVIMELVALSDVVVENFRPGVMQRLGLDYPALKQIKPDIIYCAITGYGQSGPDAERPAYAPIIHAASGYDLANMSHQIGLERPLRTGLYVADYFSALAAAGAVQGALLHRERTGIGQAVDVALMHTTLSMLAYETLAAQFPVDGQVMLYAPSRTQGGYIIVMPLTESNFAALADTADHPEWKSDPRFATFPERQQNWDALMALVEEWTVERTSRECEELLTAAGCPCSCYNTVGEAMRSAQSRHRGVMSEVDDGAGSFLVTNPPMQFSATVSNVRPWVAEPGEHTQEILCDLLGYSSERLADLADQGALITPERQKSDG